MIGAMKKDSPCPPLDVAAIRADFPMLNHNADSASSQALHYLDNAATSHKPSAVIDAISDCYAHHYGPVHRGLYAQAEDATARYERARKRIAGFIGAHSADQLIFTRSATESINMVAQGWARQRLRPGDEVWVSRMEHHANFLPWQRVCQQTGARLRLIELKADGSLDLEGAAGLYGARTQLIALCQVSNVLGVVNPIAQVVQQAGVKGIPVLVDAAQSVAHMPVNVNQLGCDFLVFSAHKMCGPNGIGALYAKPERLEEMEPLILGGGMVDQVAEEDSSWAPYPAKLEAGSANLAAAVGFAAAADYLSRLGMQAVQHHVMALTRQALQNLSHIPGIKVYGPCKPTEHAGIVAFNVKGIHPHDLAQIAGEHSVAIRAGHHCCQPLMKHLEVGATARTSFALYNQSQDIGALIEAIAVARRTLL